MRHRPWRRLLEQAGYETAEYQPEQAASYDGLVINSCTVTGESDRKLRQLLRRCRRQAPTAVLVLTGCMPQVFPQIAESFSEADIVLGNAARRALPHHLERFFASRQRIVDIPPHEKTIEPLAIEDFAGRTRAFVKIQDGCNRFCTYCIIPYARGRVRSRAPEDIRQELEALAARGYKEAVLVGINLTAYGQDTGGSIADAVEAACVVPGIARVRLGSLEPDFMTPEILARLAAQPKLCPQFHVALQSGCDATLRRMNRHYDTAAFAALCDHLRQLFPGCALTTDVMVGFPGRRRRSLPIRWPLCSGWLFPACMYSPIPAGRVRRRTGCRSRFRTQKRPGVCTLCWLPAGSVPLPMQPAMSAGRQRCCWRRRSRTARWRDTRTPI